MKLSKINIENKIEELKLSGKQFSDEDKEDLGLLLMMIDVDFNEKVTREEVISKLNS